MVLHRTTTIVQAKWLDVHKFSFVVLTVLLGLLGGATARGQTEPRDEVDVRPTAPTLRFANVTPFPRSGGMAGVGASVSLGAGSAFGNPAEYGRLDATGDLEAARTAWISKVTHRAIAGGIRPWEGRFGALGAAGRWVSFSEYQMTVRAENERGYEDLGTFAPSARELILSYGIEVTERIALGISGKQLREVPTAIVSGRNGRRAISPIVRKGFAYDVGLIFGPVADVVRFGVTIRNVASGSTGGSAGRRVNQAGGAVRLLDLAERFGVSIRPDDHRLMLVAEQHWGERITPTTRLGTEYAFRETLFLRAGLVPSRSRSRYSLGAG